ncbi:hypothetical protein [Phormidium yuhuli]|uniref:hypothetical protein n=1 Tax=Phormidium yuhuli TaxID=2974039 RepID=UPI0035A84D7C
MPKFSPQTRKAAQRAINKRRIRLSLNTNVRRNPNSPLEEMGCNVLQPIPNC